MREYKLIAHRGSHKFAKENSLFSFFNAINENYYGFECDVRQSKDKKFYIYHDMLYDGKLFKSFNSNEIICDTLESVLKLNTNKIILLEIKDPLSFIKEYSFKDDKEIFEFILNVNSKLDLKTNKSEYLDSYISTKYSDKNIYVMSFYNTVIDKLNIKNKTYKVGILNYVLNTTEKHFKYDFICILRPFLNDKIIDFVKKNNKELFVYGNYNNNFKYDFPYYIVD